MSVLWTDLAAIAIASLVLWAPGIALERVWRSSDFGHMRPLAQVVMGLATWFMITFAAASVGVFGRPAVEISASICCVAALVACWWRTRQPADLAAPARPPRPARWHLALLAALLLPHLIRSTSPVVSWDAATYHLTLPRRLLERGAFPAVDWLFYGAWPQLVETLYGAAMATRDHVLAKGLHAAAGALWLVALMRFASAQGSRWAGTMAALAVLASPVVAYELPIAYVDLAQAALLLLSFAFGQRAFDARTPRGAHAALVVAGVAGGLLAGSKLIGIGQAGVIGAGLLWRASRARDAHVRPRTVLLRYGAVAVALWLPWPIRSALETGNPVFPLLYTWFGGPRWSAELGDQLAAWHAGIGMGRGPVDWLLLPWRVATQGGPGYDRFAGDVGAHWLAVLGLGLIGATIPGPQRALTRRSLGLAGALGLMWALTSQQARLLLPALGPLALAGGLGAATVLARVRQPRARRATGAALVVVIAAGLVAWPQRTAWREARQLALLKERHGSRLTVMAMPAVARFVASQVPSDARILMLHTNQAFWIGRDVIADSTFEASQIAAWIGHDATDATAARRLAAAGVTHILAAPPRWPGAETLYPAALTALTKSPQRCRPLFRDREHALCALLPER